MPIKIDTTRNYVTFYLDGLCGRKLYYRYFQYDFGGYDIVCYHTDDPFSMAPGNKPECPQCLVNTCQELKKYQTGLARR